MLNPEILKKIRKENKLSQDDLAKITGVHYQYISDLERGIKPISKKFEMNLEKSLLLLKVNDDSFNQQQDLADNLTTNELNILKELVKNNKELLFLFCRALNGDKKAAEQVKKIL